MLLDGRPCATKCERKNEKDMAKHSLKEFKNLQVWSLLKRAMRFLCFASHLLLSLILIELIVDVTGWQLRLSSSFLTLATIFRQ